MTLRWLVALSLVSLAMGQTTTDASTAGAPTTMAPTTGEPTTMAPTTGEPTTMALTTGAPTTMAPETTMPTQPMTSPAPTDSPVELANMNLPLSDRYMRGQAVSYRSQHFFCLDQGGSFPARYISVDSSPNPNIWTIFLQYPVLAYLDSVKKNALIQQIVNLVNAGGTGALTITVNDICIGRVFHYDVSLYTESVLIQLYHRTSTYNAAQLNAAFEEGLNMANPSYIRMFGGRQAIIISNTTLGEVNQNVHPGAFRQGGDRFEPTEDPTLNAVVLGYWAQPYNLDDLAMNVNNTNTTSSARFAENPNPVFYGLTGGDIVFIVIATILCSLLAFLMVFGFCIQPFFM